MIREYKARTVKLASRKKAIDIAQAFYKETCIPAVLLYENVIMFLGVPSELVSQALILIKAWRAINST